MVLISIYWSCIIQKSQSADEALAWPSCHDCKPRVHTCSNQWLEKLSSPHEQGDATLNMRGKLSVVNTGGVEALAWTLLTAKPNGAEEYFTA